MSPVAAIAIPTGSAQAPIHTLSRGLDSRTGPRTNSSTHSPTNSSANSLSEATVFVIDNDFHIRQSLERLIHAQGWLAQSYGSVREFLARPRSFGPSTLILAISSTDPNSLEVQKQLARECAEMPIIVIADYQDIPTTVEAMKAGAEDFLVKPCSEQLLLAAIRQSLVRSRAALERGKEMRDLRNCYASLTPREQQVLALIAIGLLNKQVGGQLGISEITVKAHRGQVMQKMKANSFAHLVNMASRLRVARPMTSISLPA